MKRNVEIKAKISSDAKALIDLALKHPSYVGELPLLIQKDIYIDINSTDDRLKIRQTQGEAQVQVVYYNRSSVASPKLSSYKIAKAEEGIIDIMTAAFKVRGVVEKERKVVLIDNTRVHFDEVRDLGSFLEFEVVLDENDSQLEGEAKAKALLGYFQIPESDLLKGSYIDLILDSSSASSPRCSCK